jgi:oligopeptide/dipeptide ABC transporter ATP-binding protein
MTPLLQVDNLRTRFKSRKGYVHAVNGVSFQLDRGETLGIVGESGCGKSVTMMSMLRLLPPAAEIEAGSRVIFDGQDLLQLNAKQLREIRGSRISFIFQDPMTSLNPVLSIGTQMSEPLIFHRGMEKSAALERSGELLEMVGVADGRKRLRDYPYQLSGGMRQRVMIAMSLACEPELVIADEPTTALDVTIQAQIVEMVNDLKKQLDMVMVWITHDLGLIAGLADRIIVMYAGYIVEEASVDAIYEDPRHPYTLALIKAVPSVKETGEPRLYTIGGSPPDLAMRPSFCPFVTRCPYAIGKCRQENPALAPAPGLEGSDHRIACWVDIRGGA